jgi:toxin YoeB
MSWKKSRRSKQADEDIFYWAKIGDTQKLNKIAKLINSIKNDGLLQGIGKPEALKGEKSYSRHIDGKNRLLYKVENDELIITSARGHYTDK